MDSINPILAIILMVSFTVGYLYFVVKDKRDED